MAMNKKYIKKLVVAGFLACTTVLSTQAQTKREISVWGGGGLSTFDYSIENGNRKNGMGGLFGIGYNYFLTESWSIGSGLEISFSKAKMSQKSFADAHNSNDGEYDFVYRTSVENYREKQKATYLNIPLTAQFQLDITKEHKYYVSGGFKIGIPLSSKFKITEGTFKNSGYYPQWSNQNGRELIMDTQEFMGFGTYDQKNKEGDLNFKVAVMATLETGIKWKAGDNSSLYTGIYIDYGLNDIKKTDKHIAEYNQNNPQDFVNNSALASHWKNDNQSQKLVDKVVPFNLGLKVGFLFDL